MRRAVSRKKQWIMSRDIQTRTCCSTRFPTSTALVPSIKYSIIENMEQEEEINTGISIIWPLWKFDWFKWIALPLIISTVTVARVLRNNENVTLWRSIHVNECNVCNSLNGRRHLYNTDDFTCLTCVKRDKCFSTRWKINIETFRCVWSVSFTQLFHDRCSNRNSTLSYITQQNVRRIVFLNLCFNNRHRVRWQPRETSLFNETRANSFVVIVFI